MSGWSHLTHHGHYTSDSDPLTGGPELLPAVAGSALGGPMHEKGVLWCSQLHPTALEGLND